MKWVVFLVVFGFGIRMVDFFAMETSFGSGKIVFKNSGLVLNVEVASTRQQRRIGLMNRIVLNQRTGMLFIFEKSAIQRVWMKNTLIPLDAFFISEKGEVVSMIKNMQPCNTRPCETLFSSNPAKYMLEVNAGMIDREGIAKGQIVCFIRDESI